MEEQTLTTPAPDDVTPSGNILFNFINPYLAYIDSGRLFRHPFSWLYMLLAIINLLFPVVVLYELFDNKIFSAPFKIAIAILLIWVVIAVAGWISFQLWWDRKVKLNYTSSSNSEFVATPAFSHLIQTLGEWIGTWVGFVGSFTALFSSLILGEENRYYLGMIPYVGSSLEGGFAFVFLMPVIGFLIIVFARFIAEQIKALSSIANNTAKP